MRFDFLEVAPTCPARYIMKASFHTQKLLKGVKKMISDLF